MSSTWPDLGVLRARHAVTNTLLRYLRCVDDADLDGVLEVLGGACVSFGGAAHRGEQDLRGAYRGAFAAGGRTRHLLHPVEVAADAGEHGAGEHGAGGQGTVLARAAYQRWSLDAEPPALTALGSYHAVFAPSPDHPPGGGALVLRELRVERDWLRP